MRRRNAIKEFNLGTIENMCCEDERWSLIGGFGERYYASTCGRIFSTISTRPSGILKSAHNSAGYLSVVLVNNKKKRKTKSVARLVAATFLGNKRKMTVNHRDYVRDNNHLSNLEWLSFTDNMRHSHLRPDRKKSCLKGEQSPMAKLSNEKVLAIRDAYNGTPGQCRELAATYGVSSGHIWAIVKGKRWSHV